MSSRCDDKDVQEGASKQLQFELASAAERVGADKQPQLMAPIGQFEGKWRGVLPMKLSTFQGGMGDLGNPPWGEVSRLMEDDTLGEGAVQDKGEGSPKASLPLERPRNVEPVKITRLPFKPRGVKRPLPEGQAEEDENGMDEVTHAIGETEVTRPKKESHRAATVYPKIRPGSIGFEEGH